MTSSVPSTKNSSAVAALKGLKTGLGNVRASVVLPGGDPLLRLLKSGKWVYGRNNTEVEEDSLWAIHPGSLKHGWACWTDYKKEERKKNELVAEVMVPATEPLPPANGLPDTDRWNDQWQQQLSFLLACTNGEDAGTQALYKTTSYGGKQATMELIDQIMRQLDVDPEHIVPVVLLEVDSYNHPTWGETMNPIFDIQKWVSMDATVLPDEEEVEAAAKAQEDEPQKAAESTTGRRRQRAAPPEPDEGDGGDEVEEVEQPDPQTETTTRRRRRRG